MIEVDIVVRSDARSKNGGDSMQVAEYCRRLENEVSFRLLPFRPGIEFRSDAIVHIVNIDRPYDFLEAVRCSGDRSIIVSPIHHSLDRVRQMRRAEIGRGLRSRLDRILPEGFREWLASAVRGYRYSSNWQEHGDVLLASARSLGYVPSVWRRVGKELDRCDAVAVLARGERDDIADDTGWSALNSVVIPNGIPEIPRIEASTDRDIPILCVGRIEPRKRSLEVALEAERVGACVYFVGDVMDPELRYGSEFLALARDARSFRYLGVRDHEEVLGLMRRARVLLNASWVEVQSLVDLEAGALGVRVVSFDNGNSQEWLEDAITVVTGDSVESLVNSAVEESSRNVQRKPISYDWTWDMAASRLREVYGHSSGLGL